MDTNRLHYRYALKGFKGREATVTGWTRRSAEARRWCTGTVRPEGVMKWAPLGLLKSNRLHYRYALKRNFRKLRGNIF